MSRTIILFVATSGLLLSSCSTEPKSYEECIEKNIGKAHSDVAAKAVIHVCGRRFPKKTYSDEEVFGQQKSKPFTFEEAVGQQKYISE